MRRRWSRWERSTDRGFTIIELLVVTAVVTTIISIVVPSLAKVRSTAQAARCKCVLLNLGQMGAILSGSNGGDWPTAARRQDSPETTYRLETGTTAYRFRNLDQVIAWQLPYIGSYWEHGTGPEVWSCPAALRAGYQYGGPDGEGYRLAPASAAMLSYFTSVALFSDPKLWDPGDRQVRTHSIQFGRPIGIHEVRYPSAKIAMSEFISNHGNRLTALQSEVGALEGLFVDGHVTSTIPDPTHPSLRYDRQPRGLSGWGSFDGACYPYSAGDFGVHGRDYWR
jgi:prepilin-type N-terminal cleavage/methylation domain-containing protein